MGTEVAVDGTRFVVDGRVTYEGASWSGVSVEGLLLNSRMIQAVFDDANPVTREHWRYPDTGAWDPDRNTDEFCAALPEYRRHGLLAMSETVRGLRPLPANPASTLPGRGWRGPSGPSGCNKANSPTSPRAPAVISSRRPCPIPLPR